MTLGLVGSSFAPIRAEPVGCLSGEWVAEATRFVAEETGFHVPEVCIRFSEAEHVAALAPGGSGGAQAGSVGAVYVPGTREILLADDLDPETPLSRSYVVHELVHAQQVAAGKHLHVSCGGSLEGEAYNLQALFLRTRGLPEEAFLLQVLGLMQSACEYDY